MNGRPDSGDGRGGGPPAGRRGSRTLSRTEFEVVLRRATELSLSEPLDEDSAITEAELFRIAKEVGLSTRHVREALAEVDSSVTHPDEGRTGRWFGSSWVIVHRRIGRRAGEIEDELHAFLTRDHYLQTVRRGEGVSLYRPATDWRSKVAVAAGGGGRAHILRRSRRVEVRVDPLEERSTRIEIRVDAGLRGERIGLLGGLSGAGVGLGVGGGVVAASLGLTAGLVVPLGLLLWGGMTAAGWEAGRQLQQRRYREIRDELEGVLDHLQVEGRGEGSLPYSWPRWLAQGGRMVQEMGLRGPPKKEGRE